MIAGISPLETMKSFGDLMLKALLLSLQEIRAGRRFSGPVPRGEKEQRGKTGFVFPRLFRFFHAPKIPNASRVFF